MSEITIERSSLSLIEAYYELYSNSFPNNRTFGLEYLEWLYGQNPVGEAVGADALHQGVVVGQVICIPGKYLLHGKHCKGLLAVNVAVHPKYQGRFLFKKLGLRACEYGAQEGYDFVFGIANVAATPGWVRQMGFQLVTPLEARAGIGSLLDDDDWKTVLPATDFRHLWTKEELNWRSSNPTNIVEFQARVKSKTITGFASTGRPGVFASADFIVDENIALQNFVHPTKLILPRVFLGLIPMFRFPKSYVKIPEKLKPSPLNLIYKNLNEENDHLDPSGCLINFLDFDAF
jgi:hypothetical protein